jgi:hypothetical protein
MCEAGAKRLRADPREAGLTMRYLGSDDINKQQRSFAVIATIFIGSWSDEKHLFK